jgi:hypothetical protein
LTHTLSSTGENAAHTSVHVSTYLDSLEQEKVTGRLWYGGIASRKEISF